MDRYTVAVLCGGKGIRLRPVISDRPKPLALVEGRPFLDILLEWHHRNGAERALLLAGFMGDMIQRRYENGLIYADGAMDVDVIVEPEALDKGGAVISAIADLPDHFVLVNGDTWFPIDMKTLLYFHDERQSGLTIALSSLSIDASGVDMVNIDDVGRIISWGDIGKYANGGVYAVSRRILEERFTPRRISMERDIIPNLISSGLVYGVTFARRFTDIGTPEGYLEAQRLILASH